MYLRFQSFSATVGVNRTGDQQRSFLGIRRKLFILYNGKKSRKGGESMDAEMIILCDGVVIPQSQKRN